MDVLRARCLQTIASIYDGTFHSYLQRWTDPRRTHRDSPGASSSCSSISTPHHQVARYPVKTGSGKSMYTLVSDRWCWRTIQNEPLVKDLLATSRYENACNKRDAVEVKNGPELRVAQGHRLGHRACVAVSVKLAL